jgi:thioester reductase-like protein
MPVVVILLLPLAQGRELVLLLASQKFESFYDQSKFEAEKIVRQRIKNGLDTIIFRFGNIVGATGKYKFQRNKNTNAFYHYLRSIIKTRCSWGINANFNLSPVDICAQMLVRISFLKNSSGKTFHLFNDKTISNDSLIGILNELKYNISESERPFRESDDEYVPFLNNYLQNEGNTKYLYDNKNAKLFTKKSENKWPKITKNIIKKIINQVE